MATPKVLFSRGTRLKLLPFTSPLPHSPFSSMPHWKNGEEAPSHVLLPGITPLARSFCQKGKELPAMRVPGASLPQHHLQQESVGKPDPPRPHDTFWQHYCVLRSRDTGQQPPLLTGGTCLPPLLLRQQGHAHGLALLQSTYILHRLQVNDEPANANPALNFASWCPQPNQGHHDTRYRHHHD